MSRTDVVIVGGGIVGLASAYQLVRRFPTLHVTILEKEAELGSHQTGHNSGVLHSGIYYKPGSLRATNCRTGKQAMEEFCESEGVPYEICGKVIVAVNEAEFP
ncbi:MAG: FAD-dependent oxidoreductase, partial [Planctomycetota bacterium]|nr:FAD-dependent oxidoreductase [Planctomycetota bacterium]